MGRKAAGFVTGFLAITFALLFAYGESVESPAMSRYLFVIGKHVSFTLGLFGDDCRLEGYVSPGRRGGPQAIRDEIAAWSRGEEAPWPPREVPGAAAITPWENFQHRQLKVKRDLADAARRLDALRALAAAPNDGADALESARRRLDALKAVATYRQPDGTEQLQGNGRFRQQVGLTESRIESLVANPSADGRAAELAELERAIGELAAEQEAFLSRQYEILSRADDGMGPRIVYVHEESPERRLQRLRFEAEELRAAAEAGDTTAAERLAAVQAERDSVEEALRNRPDGASADAGRAFTFHIIPDCGALQSMIIYFAAVIAFPTRWWKRLAGVAAGLPLLYLINILRLASLGVIGARYDRQTFDFFHEIVWQAIYLVFVVAVWLLWMEMIVRPRRRSAPTADVAA